MLSRKKFGVALICGLMLCSSVHAKDVTKIEDTFSYENMENTSDASYIGGITATYTITQDNKVRAIGNKIVGSSVTTSTDVWVDILQEPFGEPLENIVGLDVSDGVVIAWDSEGGCYYIDSSGTKKLNPPEKIVKGVISDATHYLMYFIGESGTAYRSKNFTPVTVSDGVEVKFKDVAVSDNTKTYSILLAENGDIYIFC